MHNPIQLICGLGNAATQYQKTRHNIGFAWLDLLTTKQQLSWRKSAHGEGVYSQWHSDGQKLLLFKPGTLMNISGNAIRSFCQYQQIPVANILVIHDDLETPVAKLRWKNQGSHGGHNGVRDCIKMLQSDVFARLRIGIGRPINPSSISQYVLSKPTPPEAQQLQQCLEFSVEHANLLATQQLDKYQYALQQWNQQQSQ